MKLIVDDLVAQGLVAKKTYTEGIYKGLSVLKYTNKVFFKNLWHLDTRLLDCRGTVIDEDNNIIVLPFTKVFNLGENNTYIDPDNLVTTTLKVNGFMAAVTVTEKYGIIVSTTGTLDSPFANLARKWLLPYADALVKGGTLLFEVCDPSDPHIVKEDSGVYLIGVRSTNTGMLMSEEDCDILSDIIGINRYNSTKPRKFSEVLLNLKIMTQEGFMVHDAETGNVLCKLKSPHYLTKKALMRLGKNTLELLFKSPEVFKERVDEELYSLVDYIVLTYTKEVWGALKEQGRRNLIEEYFNK